jgi:hypothetical protein
VRSVNCKALTPFLDYYFFLALHYGSPAQVGIAFDIQGSASDSALGNGALVQIANAYVQRRQGSDWQSCSAYGLDGGFPYPDSDDSPGCALLAPYQEEYTASEAFDTWLMFSPPGGVWVPVSRVGWYWTGDAVDTNGGWLLVSHSNNANPTGTDTTTYPQWSQPATFSPWE